MNPSIFLDISAYLGLVATVLLTFNILLGMMLSTAYKKHRYWKQLPDRLKQINIVWLHNLTAYIALLIVLLHPILLLFVPSIKFKLLDIIFPINAEYQKLFMAFGTISMYALIVVLISTQKVVKKKMPYTTWKKIHLISYATALLFIVHGLIMDPQLKDRPLNLWDTEKLVSECCVVLILAAVFLRYKSYLRTKNARQNKV